MSRRRGDGVVVVQRRRSTNSGRRARDDAGDDGDEEDDEDEIDTNDFDDQSDITKPHELIEISPDTPLTQVQAMQLWDRIDRVKIDAKRARRATAKKLMKAAGGGGKLELLDFRMKIVWTLLAAALASSGAALAKIVTWAGDARETSIMIQRLTVQEQDLGIRLRAIEETVTRSVVRLDDIIQKVNNK